MTERLVDHGSLMDQMLADPELREEWQKSAFARAIAAQVIRFRIEHKLSQRALAQRLGVSQGLIGRLELGEHEPRVSTLQMLTRTLGIRFTIDIHPVDRDQVTDGATNDGDVARITFDGVETLVRAS